MTCFMYLFVQLGIAGLGGTQLCFPRRFLLVKRLDLLGGLASLLSFQQAMNTAVHGQVSTLQHLLLLLLLLLGSHAPGCLPHAHCSQHSLQGCQYLQISPAHTLNSEP